MVERWVVLRDVTLRDGLQDEAPVSTAAKLGLYEYFDTGQIGKVLPPREKREKK